MSKDKPLHNYSHVLANQFRAGQIAVLPELHQALIDELKQEIKPEPHDLMLLLENITSEDLTKTAQESSKNNNKQQKDKQEVLDLIKAVMILLEQDKFYQGVKSYHLNLMKRTPINDLEVYFKTRNFEDVYARLKSS